jgi:hypothetical protein
VHASVRVCVNVRVSVIVSVGISANGQLSAPIISRIKAFDNMQHLSWPEKSYLLDQYVDVVIPFLTKIFGIV